MLGYRRGMAKKPAKPKAKAAKKAAKPTKKAAKPAAKKAKAPAKPATKPRPKPAPVKAVSPKPAPEKATKAEPVVAVKAAKPVVPETGSANAGASSDVASDVGTTPIVGTNWKAAVREEIAKLPNGLAAYCVQRGKTATDAWEVADSDALRGLEAWGTELAHRDRRLGVAVLVGVAQIGYPRAMKAAGSKADNMGFHASEGSMDGAPVETQIARGAAWAADPSDQKFDEVVAGLDPSRQLNVWDEDLLPQSDEDGWFWYSEVGQCIAHAISGEGGDPEGTSYYEWTPAQSVGRGLVMAIRGIRKNNNDANMIDSVRVGLG